MRAPLAATPGRALASGLVLATLLLAGCAERAAPDSAASLETVECEPALPAEDASWRPERPRVRLNTTMGSFVAELDVERAPVTAGNFLDLGTRGFYDGTLFHRVVRDFVIQGGDPLSKDDDPSNDGTGDPGYEIPDELHPDLRHDAIGVLSMANSGPGTGGSQFFVTLAQTPHLDDRHSVFGRVVEGLDVVRAIGQVPVDASDAPIDPVRVESIEIDEPTAFEPTHGVALHVVVPEKRAEPQRPVRFAVVMQNEGNLRDALALGATLPPGWSCEASAAEVVPAGTARVGFLSLTPPAGAEGMTEIPVFVASASGERATGSVDVAVGALGREVRDGDRVVANYAGLLPDGRLFDTSMRAAGEAEAQPKFDTMGGWRPKTSYEPFTFTVGSGVIAGFTELARTAKVGETVTTLIPAEDAYATGNPYERPLTGRDLVFELEIVSLA